MNKLAIFLAIKIVFSSCRKIKSDSENNRDKRKPG